MAMLPLDVRNRSHQAYRVLDMDMVVYTDRDNLEHVLAPL
jgi:hypothetical protein